VTPGDGSKFSMSPVAVAANSSSSSNSNIKAAASVDWQQNWQFQSSSDGAGDFPPMPSPRGGGWLGVFGGGVAQGMGTNSICVKNTFSYCAYFKCYTQRQPQKQQQQ